MRLLVVLSRVPYPLDKGDKLRAYNQLKELSKWHDIDLVALSDKDIHPDAHTKLSSFCNQIHVIKLNKLSILWNVFIAFLSGKPFQLGYFYSGSINREITRLMKELKPDHVYGQLVRVAEYLKDFEGGKTLDFQDALSMGMKRRADKSTFVKKWLFQSEYLRLKKYEQKVLSTFSDCTIISHPDRLLIQNQTQKAIRVIANGVDFDFFKPIEKEKKYELVFTGNMNYPPNVKSAIYLVKEILPLVHQKNPEVKLLLAGATPHEHVRRLASSHVEVSGWMDDIRDAYASAHVFIAPMQIGTGLQNKLLEAMAMKIPSITSELANNALNAKEQTEVLVGSSPQEYADHIIRLLSDQTFANQISENAFAFVTKNYSWESACKQLSDIFENSNT